MMSREEAILLVSRALACIMGAYAITEALYLPVRLFDLYHYLDRSSFLAAYSRSSPKLRR